MTSPRLLLVEDDPELRAMLTELLSEEGYAVDAAADGQRGLHLGLTREYDVLLLDRGLPAVDGLHLLGRLRSAGRVTPALVLSALGNPRDRVEGLDAGAEDYLGKPFDLEELLARLRALVRRHLDHVPVLAVLGGSFDVSTRSVRLADGGEVALSDRESSLLGLLARNPRRVFGRDELLESVFEDAEEAGVVDTYVHYLRRKLGRGVVETVRGLGYRAGRP
ncbi:MAG: response regulator transcription factor [Nocardioidaceae bacterium]